MRALNSNILDAANLAEHERLFVELWHSMTHVLSLDSYRVRCMNSRTIIRELSEELRIGLISDIELKALCAEIDEILSSDPIIKDSFSAGKRAITPFLSSPPIAKDTKDKVNRATSEPWRQFMLTAEDFSVALEQGYFYQLITALPLAIKPNNEDDIHAVLGSLLSDLVDRGWTIDALHRWHTKFLPDADGKIYPFNKNLEFLLAQLSRGKQEFRVSLRLTGSNKLSSIGAFHSLNLASTITLLAKNEAEKRFAEPNPLVTFATTTIQAVDAMSAAIETRTIAEQLLDLMRFDYEHRKVVRIEDQSYVRRNQDGRSELIRIRHAVPNPREEVNDNDFHRFLRELDGLTNKPRLAASACRQLNATIRQYRFGSDSEDYRYKFLSWWMGLEALTVTGHGKTIGETVTLNASRAMMLRYVFRLVRDLLTTLKYIRIEWPTELAGHTSCATLNDLTISQLLVLLQSNTHAEKLWQLCVNHPMVVYRGKSIEKSLSSPKAMLEKLSSHLRHLEWHIARLYRIRCCIVHGSPIRFHLGLFAANLEFYLKELTRFTLATFRDNDHIESLEELFHRVSITNSRTLSNLEDSHASADTVREALFSDVVVRERPT
jgi:hypothetical protein